MTYAKIENGVCTNVIACDDAFAREFGYILAPDGYGIGDSFDGETWTKAPQPEPDPEPEPAPTEMEQLRADVDFLAAMTGVSL